jgi:hypothetical protein
MNLLLCAPTGRAARADDGGDRLRGQDHPPAARVSTQVGWLQTR